MMTALVDVKIIHESHLFIKFCEQGFPFTSKQKAQTKTMASEGEKLIKSTQLQVLFYFIQSYLFLAINPVDHMPYQEHKRGYKKSSSIYF